MTIKSVKPLQDYQIQVVFDDDVHGIIDLSQFVLNGVFTVLRDKSRFDAVYNTGYSIAWNDELEIDALNVYAEITNKDPQDIFILDYAAN